MGIREIISGILKVAELSLSNARKVGYMEGYQAARRAYAPLDDDLTYPEFLVRSS